MCLNGRHGESPEEPADNIEFYPSETAPRVLNIVLCRFPFKEAPKEPPLRRSPCLVWRVRRYREDGMTYVSVFFGTSNLKTDIRLHRDLIIQNARSLRKFGLHRATRFDLDRTADLPWSPDWFPCPAAGTSPIIGMLDEAHKQILIARLKQKRDREAGS